MESTLLYSKSTHLNVYLIQNTLTETSRMFDHISSHLDSAKLTHKINLHIVTVGPIIALKTQQEKANNPITDWTKDMNRNFTKELVQMANKHMKMYFALLAIREM